MALPTLAGMLPSLGQLGRAETEEKKRKRQQFIMKEAELIQGRTEAQLQRAKNLVPVKEIIPEYGSIREAYVDTGAQLQNPEIAKDPAWWQKALSKLEPLQWLDIPVELLTEAIVDPISMATGKQLSPLRGSAPREQFEAWKAFNPFDDKSERTGFWEFKDRMDIAAGAFEKRPLKMQLALGALQIAATMGAGALPKAGALAASSSGKLLIKAAKTGAGVVDPWEVAAKGVSTGVRGARNIYTKPSRKSNPDGSSTSLVRDDRGLPITPRGVQEALTDSTDLDSFSARFFDLGEAPEQFILEGMPRKVGQTPVEKSSILGRVFAAEGREASVLHPSLIQGNSIRDFIASRWRRGQENYSGYTAIAEGANDVAKRDLLNAALNDYKEMFAFQIQNSTGLRYENLGFMTYEDLAKFTDFALDLEDGVSTMQPYIRTHGGKWGFEEGAKDYTATVIHTKDSGQALVAGKLLKNTLDEWAKTYGIKLDKNAAIFTLDARDRTSLLNLPTSKADKKKWFWKLTVDERAGLKKKTTTSPIQRMVNHINTTDKEFGIGGVKSVFFPKDAHGLRAQKATEMIHTGNSVVDIKRMLEHKDLGVTATYLREAWNISDDSIPGMQVRLTRRVLDSLTDEQREVFKQKGKEYRKLVNDAERVAEGEAKRVKGRVVGGDLYRENWIETGEALFNTPLGRQLAFDSSNENVSQLLEGLGTVDVEEHVRNVKNFVEDFVVLDGLRNVAIQTGLGKQSHQALIKSIYHPYKSNFHLEKVATKKGTKFDKPGLIQRAGFAVDKKTGKMRWMLDSPDEAVRAHWQERWDDFRVENPIGAVLGDNRELWRKWAQETYQEVKNAEEALDGLLITNLKSDSVDRVLAEYTNLKVQHLRATWTGLQNMVDSSRARIIRNKLDEWENFPINSPADTLVEPAEQYRRLMSQVRKGFETRVAGNNHLAKLFKIDPETNKLNVAIKDSFSEVEIDNALAVWFKDEYVSKVLSGRRFHYGMSAKKIKDSLRNLATRNPRIFGDDFATKVGDKTQLNLELTNWIEALGDIIAGRNRRNHWEHIHAVEAYRYLGPEAAKEMPQLRPMFDPEYAASIRYRGLNADELGGRPLMLAHQVERIRPEARIFGKNISSFIHNNPIGKLLKTPTKTIWAAASGGQAGIARPIAKVIAGRNRAYYDAGYTGDNVKLVFNQVGAEELGLGTQEASAAMLQNGIDKGNQFFNQGQKGLKVKSAEEIRAFEESQEGLIAYSEYATKTGPVERQIGGVFHKLRSVSREGETGMNSGSLSLEYLTQVDVVLERMMPQHWEKYFDLSDDQYNALLFLKKTLHDVDQKAVDRGVDLVGMIQDKGGEYLKNYFPRLFRIGNRVRLSNRKAMDGIPNSFKDHFVAREHSYKDIVNVLAHSMGDAATKEGVGRGVLEDFGTRAGEYTETIWKTVADEEAKKMIMLSREYATALKGGKERALEIYEMNNLERILNDVAGGAFTVDEDRFTQLGDAKFTFGGEQNFTGMSILSKLDGGGEKARLWAANNKDRIIKDMEIRRLEIDKNWGNKMGEEVQGAEWMDSLFATVSKQDKEAMLEHLRVENNILGDVAKWPALGLRKPTQAMRYLKAGLDMGVPMIHGFNSLARLPVGLTRKEATAGYVAWGKGFKGMLTFFLDPDNYDEYRIANFLDMQEASKWVRMGYTEPIQAGLGSDIMNQVRTNLGKYVDPKEKIRLLDRFEAGFSGYLDIARLELWKAIKPSVDNALLRDKKLGLTRDMLGNADNLSPDVARVVRKQYHELGAVINKMTGAFDPEFTMQTPYQKLIENSLLMFAPMYRRATFGIMADIFGFGTVHKSGLRFRQGLKQLSGIVAVGGMMGFLSELSGNNDRGFLFDKKGELDLDRGEGGLDLSARFGKFNTNGVQVGIGTAWWTAFRLASDMAMYMSKPDAGDIVDEKDWKDHWVWNVLGRRGRSQLAPGSAFIVDAVQGRNFLGEPLKDPDENNWAALATHLGVSATPFWLDGAVSGNTPGGVAVATVSEFLGVQSYNISSYDNLSNARNTAARTWGHPDIKSWRDNTDGPVNYINMPKRLQQLIDDENPMAAALFAEHEELYGPIARGTAKQWREFSQEKATINHQGTIELAKVSRNWEQGQISGRDLQQALSKVTFLRGSAHEALITQPKYEALANRLSDVLNSESPGLDEAFVGDIVYNKFQQLNHSDDYNDIDGEFLYHQWSQDIEAFWNDPNHGIYREYVEARQDDWLRTLPSIFAFTQAKRELGKKNYWDIEDYIFEQGIFTKEQQLLAAGFLKQSRTMRDYMMSVGEGKTGRQNEDAVMYRWMDLQVRTARERMRREDAEVDRMLVTWYGYIAKHPQNRGLSAMLEKTKRGYFQSNSSLTARYDLFDTSPTGRTFINEAGGIERRKNIGKGLTQLQ